MILTVALFAIPVLTLLIMGIMILARPISVINRRWYLAIIAPLLAANPISLLNNLGSQDWSSGETLTLILVLIADAAIVTGFFWVFRGAVVHGLSETETQQALKEILEKQGHQVKLRTGEKSFLWARYPGARIIAIENGDTTKDLWVAESVNEVVIRADSQKSHRLLVEAVPELRKLHKPYRFKDHAMGILYLVVALIFSVLVWIYFFEPRLILVN
jgi:hypothetical protein